MRLQFEMTTSILPKGRICQQVTAPGIDNFDARAVILRQVYNTLDEQVRAALIKMGWTPPKTIAHIPADDSEGGLTD